MTEAAVSMPVARDVRRLLVVSHVLHYQHCGALYAYGPYAREIDIWADLFETVIIASPCRCEEPPGDCVPFTRPNIAMASPRETGGNTWRAKVKQIVLLPYVVGQLCRQMRCADAIHVRCPGNLGLLGVLLAPCFSRYLIAKYAGQWNRHPNERFTLWLQRALLKSRWWRGPVTVYGEWPDQPRHVHSFFTSVMTSDQVERAKQVAREKEISLPLRVLFSGRLEPEKNVPALLRAVRLVVDSGVALDVAVVGDGSQHVELENLVEELRLRSQVRFVGAVTFEQNLAWYRWTHCLVQPARWSEGWPKVIAEAMCHGVLCLGGGPAHVAHMLEQRGVLLKQGTAEEIAAALVAVSSNPSAYRQTTAEASRWACQFSLEGLRDALSRLLVEQWGITSSRLVSAQSLVRHRGQDAGAAPVRALEHR